MVVAGAYPEAWALMDMMTAPSTIGAVAVMRCFPTVYRLTKGGLGYCFVTGSYGDSVGCIF